METFLFCFDASKMLHPVIRVTNEFRHGTRWSDGFFTEKCALAVFVLFFSPPISFWVTNSFFPPLIVILCFLFLPSRVRNMFHSFQPTFTELEQVSSSWTVFPPILPIFIGFHLVLLRFDEFCQVFQVLPSFTEFYCVFTDFTKL